MKIGIITLSASDNCGSLLQAYALRNMLKKYGDAEIINFSSKASHAIYDLPVYKGIKRIKNRRKIKRLADAKNDYEAFRRDHLCIKGREYLNEDLTGISDRYDVVVTGSDQVWNVQMGDFDEAFFLGWTDAKKVAYAPSLGGRDLRSSSNFSMIEKWLSDFSFLSVREQPGKDCLEEITGKKVPKLPDPTLTVDEELWYGITEKPLIAEEYIFYYSWAYCEESTSKIVADEAQKTGLPVYVIDPRKWMSGKYKKWGFRLYEKTGPLVFLNLMRYAKRVYVESFHGMVFAYTFRKDYWLLDTHRDLKGLDARLMEFVELLDALDRIITPYNVSDIDQDRPVKYSDNVMLSGLREESRKFLDEAVGGAVS